MLRAEDIDLVQLTKKDDRCWALLPQVLDRVRAFGHRIGDLAVEELVTGIETAFIQADDRIGVWILIAGQRVIAHLVVTSTMQWLGRSVGFVIQVAVDRRSVPPAILRESNDAMRQWIAARGCKETLCFVSDVGVYRLLRRYFGFVGYRVLLRQAGAPPCE